MPFRAKYPSTCPACHNFIEPGQLIDRFPEPVKVPVFYSDLGSRRGEIRGYKSVEYGCAGCVASHAQKEPA